MYIFHFGALVRGAQKWGRFLGPGSDKISVDSAERFTAHAAERGVEPATPGVVRVSSYPAVTAPTIGARNVDQQTCIGSCVLIRSLKTATRY